MHPGVCPGSDQSLLAPMVRFDSVDRCLERRLIPWVQTKFGGFKGQTIRITV